MSNEQDKFKHSKRLLKDQNAIKKQTKIAKENNIPLNKPHRFAKHHAMNCGNPKCYLCSNPRRVWNELTQQEKRLFQDLDKVRNNNKPMEE
jgi:hypothetical protein